MIIMSNVALASSTILANLSLPTSSLGLGGTGPANIMQKLGTSLTHITSLSSFLPER